VSIIEDDPLIRSLVASHLENAGFQVSVAGNFVDGMRLIESVDPDAVVLDIDLGPGPGGMEIAERLQGGSEDVAIVFLTSLSDPRFSNSVKNSVPKNAAYLNKHLLTDAQSIVDALNAVLTGRGIKNFRHDLDEERPLNHLSRVQIQVLRLISEGKTNQQIADIRGRSLAATESVITRTLAALGLDSEPDRNARVAAAHRFMSMVNVPQTETPQN
jgi:DNA-binding NarL/FixJ family response regulator